MRSLRTAAFVTIVLAAPLTAAVACSSKSAAPAATPDAATWSKLTTAGTVKVTLIAARLTQNQLASGSHAVAQTTITIKLAK